MYNAPPSSCHLKQPTYTTDTATTSTAPTSLDQCSHGCLQPISAAPSFLARYINCSPCQSSPTAQQSSVEHTKNHMLAPRPVAKNRYRGRAGWMWTGCAPAGLGRGAGPAMVLYSVELEYCQRGSRKGIYMAYRLLFQWCCYLLAPLLSSTVVMSVVEVKHAKMRQARDRPRRTVDFPRFTPRY